MSDIRKEKIFKIIATIMRYEQSSINEATTAKDIPGWDSLKHMRLIMALEKEFGIKFKTSQIAAMQNVGEIINAVREQD